MPLSSPLIFDIIFRHAESTSLLIFDRSGTIEDINAGFQKLLGYSRDSLLGKNISTLYTVDDNNRKVPEKMIERTIQSGATRDDYFLKHQNGSPIWIHSECIFARDKDGQEHLVEIIQDLNKERLLEEKLIEKNREQENTISDHETFIYTTSHDLRSPLNNLDALIQNVQESNNDPEAIAHLAPLLNESIARLRDKINELSLIGKMREEENKRSIVVLETIYNEVLKDLEQEIRSSDALLSADFSKVPVLRFSKKNIRSLLHNLISNSLKYHSPHRKPVIKVETEETEDGWILLTVEDNGLGIAEEEKEKIFDMYTRLHAHVEGTGVGLGIVKKIVNNNGGKIALESQLGKGSLFKIYLKGEEAPSETA